MDLILMVRSCGSTDVGGIACRYCGRNCKAAVFILPPFKCKNHKFIRYIYELTTYESHKTINDLHDCKLCTVCGKTILINREIEIEVF